MKDILLTLIGQAPAAPARSRKSKAAFALKTFDKDE
jgi:hypothetical protein